MSPSRCDGAAQTTSDQLPHPARHRGGGDRSSALLDCESFPCFLLRRGFDAGFRTVRCRPRRGLLHDRLRGNKSRLSGPTKTRSRSSGSAPSVTRQACSPSIAPSTLANAAGWFTGTEIMRPKPAQRLAHVRRHPRRPAHRRAHRRCGRNQRRQRPADRLARCVRRRRRRSDRRLPAP